MIVTNGKNNPYFIPKIDKNTDLDLNRHYDK